MSSFLLSCPTQRCPSAAVDRDVTGKRSRRAAAAHQHASQRRLGHARSQNLRGARRSAAGRRSLTNHRLFLHIAIHPSIHPPRACTKSAACRRRRRAAARPSSTTFFLDRLIRPLSRLSPSLSPSHERPHPQRLPRLVSSTTPQTRRRRRTASCWRSTAAVSSAAAAAAAPPKFIMTPNASRISSSPCWRFLLWVLTP